MPVLSRIEDVEKVVKEGNRIVFTSLECSPVVFYELLRLNGSDISPSWSCGRTE